MDAPEIILELAGACVVAVANATKIQLDFTQETLPILDHYVKSANGPREEILGLVAPMCGAYFGEVVRRSLGSARWHVSGEDHTEYRLEFEDVFLHFNPVGMALEALLEQTVTGCGATLGLRDRERVAVEKAVELYGDVREDDYFRLSVRYEVVEQVVETLRSVKNEGEVPAITADAYEAAALAERGGDEPLPN